MWMGYGYWPRGLAPKERQHAQRLSCARMCQSSYASCLPNGERPRAGKPRFGRGGRSRAQHRDWRRGTRARRRGLLCQAARPDACRCLGRPNAPAGAALPGPTRHGRVEHQVRACTVCPVGRTARSHQSCALRSWSVTSNPCCFTAPCDVWRHGSTLIHELTHAVDMVRPTLVKGEDPFRFSNQSRAAEQRTLAAVHGTEMARAPATPALPFR